MVTSPPQAQVPMEIFTGPSTFTVEEKLLHPCSFEWNFPFSTATASAASAATRLTVPSSATAIPSETVVLSEISVSVSRFPLVKSTLKSLNEPCAMARMPTVSKRYKVPIRLICFMIINGISF